MSFSLFPLFPPPITNQHSSYSSRIPRARAKRRPPSFFPFSPETVDDEVVHVQYTEFCSANTKVNAKEAPFFSPPPSFPFFFSSFFSFVRAAPANGNTDRRERSLVLLGLSPLSHPPSSPLFFFFPSFGHSHASIQYGGNAKTVGIILSTSALPFFFFFPPRLNPDDSICSMIEKWNSIMP